MKLVISLDPHDSPQIWRTCYQQLHTHSCLTAKVRLEVWLAEKNVDMGNVLGPIVIDMENIRHQRTPSTFVPRKEGMAEALPHEYTH